ncbi:glyoxalase/bleomycin resistance/extradiol dioxygenase family protein [Aromatoleum toluvorans]|uniref:Glyoxalase/bleomycin resistance/extradiol dioxygenase family protein n=1 Tax=Aromatoleum toluvorans TaxID=92002 RepID=A0ABX1Q7L3_9RHOO|nr:VOC family protein [Aromatoleum toluvorans]NMG46356.1 glyoxalase/bleomycin resistance/extradiol dioxygenase family protein [Aromatoleum toluvorans]
MARQIYVNLPVRDLPRTREFFSALGFSFEPKFSNDNGACMVIEDNIFAMLLAEPFFRTFTKKSVCDTTQSTEVLLCLSCDSRAHVKELVAKAVAAGGRVAREDKDHGFMYEHAFEDLDGHTWELVYMEPDAHPH